MKRMNKRLGQLLVEKGLLSEENILKALQMQRQTGEFLGKILLDLGMMEEEMVLKILAEQWGIRFISLAYRYIDWKKLNAFSKSLIFDYQCLPLEVGDDLVVVAITNPLDHWALKKVEEEVGKRKVEFVLVTRKDMQEALKRYKEYLRNSMSNLFKSK